jgi:hypothetical protein
MKKKQYKLRENMQLDEKIGLGILGILIVAASFSLVEGQNEVTGPINASISQPICIQASGNLTAGIFFTNRTTIGVQYPITDMTVANNATGNYWGPGGGTVYNVTACSGNTINVTVYQSACDNLKNGTNEIFVDYAPGDAPGEGGQGLFFGNGTTPTAPTLNTSSPPPWTLKVDTFVLIGYRLDKNENIYLRYWLNPRPNNAPSGVYNTTYLIRAVEFGTLPGSGAC